MQLGVNQGGGKTGGASGLYLCKAAQFKSIVKIDNFYEFI